MVEYEYKIKDIDNPPSHIVDVKIIKEVTIPENELAIVQKYIPNFKEVICYQ